MYPFERFTERAKKVLTLAQEEAERSHHSYIGTEHLLLGLLREGEGMGAKVLNSLGVEIGEVRQTIEKVLGSEERIVIQQIIPTSRVKKVIELAFDEARRMGNNYVGTEHLLIGLLIEGEGIAAHVLQDLGATLDRARQQMSRLLETGETSEAEEPAPGPLPPFVPDALRTVGDLATRLADTLGAPLGPEHILLALLDSDPLVRRMAAALGIDRSRLDEARRIATPPPELAEMRRAFAQRVSEIRGRADARGRMRRPPSGARSEPTGAEWEELRHLRRDLEEAERRWREGGEADAPNGGAAEPA